MIKKKNIQPDFLSEIERIVLKVIPDIKYRAKLQGIRTVENWQDYLSEEALDKAKDVNISDQKYFIDFGGEITNKLMHVMQEIYPEYTISDSGYYYYPKTGYMGWHTNSNRPCKRVYITNSDGEAFFRYVKDDKIVIGNTIKLTLACDHRTVDGVTGSLFLETLKGYVENPVTMLV